MFPWTRSAFNTQEVAMTAFLHAAPLADRHEDGTRADPCYSPRDHARKLSMTEADLVEMDEGIASARLRPEWPSLLAAIWSLGPTMAQTCSEHAVLETVGNYPRLQGDVTTARFAGSRVDVRLLLPRCAHVWAVKHGGRCSLQVFGEDGAAIHTVHLTSASNRAGWMQLLEAYAAPDLTAQALLKAGGPLCPHLDDRSAVARIHARHRIAPQGVWPVAADSLRTILQAASETRLPIELTVGNPGCTHSCKGSAASVRVTPAWLHVADPYFSLRVREAAIAEAWIVARQTEYGVADTLEVFDRSGRMIAALSGGHDAARPEERLWRAILDALPLSARPPAPA
jgi:putative hemin transport protein